MDSFDEDEAIRFFGRDEIVDGAVYRVDLRKIRYDSSFNRPMEGDEKARLRWKLEEKKTIKMGSLPLLVESICHPSGDLDTIFLDILLTTYRSFTSTSLLLKTILEWFEKIVQDKASPQKENCKRSIRHALLLWLTKFKNDFHDPPYFPALISLRSFAHRHFSGSDLYLAAEKRVKSMVKSEESSFFDYYEDELSLNSVFDVVDSICSIHPPRLIPPLDIFNIPSSYFAEQLTYLDAKLFCDVIPQHCLGSIWSKRSNKKLSSLLRPYSVLITVEQFNAVSFRVISTILKWPYQGLACRTAILDKWISIAQECRKFKNFSSLKAILAGLQSNSIFRLKKVWQALSKETMEVFKGLEAIFSEENNQAMLREILNKEGTAKRSDVETVSTTSRATQASTVDKGGLLANRKKTQNPESQLRPTSDLPVRGTVPYLGTFLTDLMMLDAAFPDVDPETSLINFEKKRKEFEVLAQIQILQSTCNLYKIAPDPSFFDWFYGIRTYDEGESHELSLEIEPSNNTIGKDSGKGHKKNLSLGYFTVKKKSGVDDMLLDPMTCSIGGKTAQSLKDMPALSKVLASQLETLSFISTKSTLSDLKHAHSNQPPSFTDKSGNIMVKVELICDQSHDSNFYKSIMISNKDHFSNVMKKILNKFSVEASPDGFRLSQILENGSEIDLPERGNVFYAIKLSNDVKLVARPKNNKQSKDSKFQSRGVSAHACNRNKHNNNRLSKIFGSMVSLVPS